MRISAFALFNQSTQRGGIAKTNAFRSLVQPKTATINTNSDRVGPVEIDLPWMTYSNDDRVLSVLCNLRDLTLLHPYLRAQLKLLQNWVSKIMCPTTIDIDYVSSSNRYRCVVQQWIMCRPTIDIDYVVQQSISIMCRTAFDIDYVSNSNRYRLCVVQQSKGC